MKMNPAKAQSSKGEFDPRLLLSVLTATKKGDFSARMPLDWIGIHGKIADTLNDIIDTNDKVSRELDRVSKAVGKEGKLAERASFGPVSGAWARKVESVNALITDLARPTMEMARVIGAVAKGDLNQTMILEVDGKAIQGEFMRTGKIVNTMVDQLGSFASEVTRVAREVGTEGKLGGQADVRGVAGTWKDLTDNVNMMAGNLTGQVRNIAEVTTAVANGDLSKKITVDVKGEILELKNTINTMVDQLGSFASEVTRVAREVGTDGKLGGQADVRGVAGNWKDLTDNVNFMASNLTSQVRAIAKVVTAVANGDLSKKITVDVKGEILELKDTINTMVDQLNAFASEVTRVTRVTRVAREVGTDGKLGDQAQVKGVAGTWKDIIDRGVETATEFDRVAQQAEEALLKAGALQNAIFNSANFSSIATDAKGVIQIFNVGAERMLGYTAAEVMNKITPADISDPQEVIARAKTLSFELATPIAPGFEALVFKASRGIEDIYELTYIRKDGSRFPAVVSVTALRDAQSAIIGYLLIGTDNTARKEAEEALLRAGALQSAIFNSANFSSIATDAKGVIQIFNVGAERMLGYTAVEVMNKITPADISDPQEVIARAEALSLELATPIAPGFEALVFKASRGIEDIYELTYIRKDGSRFPAVVSVTALRDAQSAIIGYLLIGTDNTARKEVEEERMKLDQRLRDQQFYTRSLIESNIDAIMTTDPRGIISDVNQQMEALTGCTRDELIGAPFKNYFTDPERAEAAITRVLREGKVTNYELTAHARDGKEMVVSYNATTFHDRDRRLQGVFAAARDVTESKRLDQVLQEKNVELQSAKVVAEEANRSKSNFLSSMSHELRSPLNAILGFAQLMESDSPAPTPGQEENIGQILQAGWHLLKLINEILDLAKIESGQLSLSPESVSLAEVMLECQSMIEGQAQKRGIQMTFPQFDIPYFIHADRTRLKQTLINLLSNAIKYNRERGTVEVQYAASAPGRIRVSIKDTGAGLPPEKLAQLFQPFNRLGQEASGEEGTGIGLVVAKQLIELMGGVIGVESAVGVGSVFWFELMAAAEPQFTVGSGEPKAPAQSQAQSGTRVRILLYVEDNPANLKLVEQVIARRPDLRLLSAVTGNLGIELARANQPEVILMDINLPDISGIEALKVLRKDPATAHIPVVAITANAMPHDIENGLQAGFFRYLTKPIKVNEFMDTLNTALEFAEKGVGQSK
jgi:PAS domain S-box-containing protein